MNRLIALLAAGGILIGVATASSAATMRFTPPGAQVDGDAILDIVTAKGAVIVFEVEIDTMGLPGPLSRFDYTATWDKKELELVGMVNLDPGGNFAVDTGLSAFALQGGSGTVGHAGGAVVAGGGFFVLDIWTFKVLDGLDNDGNSDFRIEKFAATATVGGLPVAVLGNYNQFQQVEVQPCPPPAKGKGVQGQQAICSVPEPATWLLVWTGLLGLLGFAWFGRGRTRTSGA